MIRLADPERLRAAGYGRLIEPARLRDGDRIEGLFVAEGARTVRNLLERGWPVESLLVSENRVRPDHDLIETAESAGVEVLVAGQDLFDSITGFHIHRGVLALARRPPDRRPDELVGTPGRLLLVVEGVNDHENLGALFRNAAAFGVAGAILDPTTADPLYRRSIRVSLGHVLAVPYARDRDWPAGLDQLAAAGWTVVALCPSAGNTLEEVAGLAEAARAGRSHGGERATTEAGAKWAVMVGAEGPGLSPAAMRKAAYRARIPMAAGVDSLNVATAAAIAFHVLGRRPPPAA